MNTGTGGQERASDYYAVVRFSDGFTLSEKFDLGEAARLLEPGTCYGWGPSKMAATAKALSEAVRIRKQELVA